MEEKALNFWGIVELFGHNKIAGFISAENRIGGGELIRVDVPEVAGSAAFSKFYGAKAVYAITPTSEELARAYIEQSKPAPLSIYMPVLHKPLPARKNYPGDPIAEEADLQEDDAGGSGGGPNEHPFHD